LLEVGSKFRSSYLAASGKHSSCTRSGSAALGSPSTIRQSKWSELSRCLNFLISSSTHCYMAEWGQQITIKGNESSNAWPMPLPSSAAVGSSLPVTKNEVTVSFGRARTGSACPLSPCTCRFSRALTEKHLLLEPRLARAVLVM
jgi:hypothetical protein